MAIAHALGQCSDQFVATICLFAVVKIIEAIEFTIDMVRRFKRWWQRLLTGKPRRMKVERPMKTVTGKVIDMPRRKPLAMSVDGLNLSPQDEELVLQTLAESRRAAQAERPRKRAAR
jgi:hypothetical protein